MKSFLIANPKGGSGKSILATNLAGYFARCGHQVMLGDTDRQQSAREWLAIRPGSLPPIRTWDVEQSLPARPPKGTTHVRTGKFTRPACSDLSDERSLGPRPFSLSYACRRPTCS